MTEKYPPKLPILMFIPPGTPPAPPPQPLTTPRAIPRAPIPVRSTPWTSYVIRARDDNKASKAREIRNTTVPREAAGASAPGISTIPPIKPGSKKSVK